MTTDQESGPAYVHLNGRLLPAMEARISVFDHGLLYADGLFETVRVANGRCFRPEVHLARLEESAARLALPLPWPRSLLHEALQKTAEANGLQEGALRLTVTRGPGSPIPDPSVCPDPTYFITSRTVAPFSEETFERGLRLSLGPEHPRLFVPGLKSLCYLPYQLARATARAAGCDDAILLWGDQIVETGISNLFLVRNGKLVTPDLKSGCLPGIARALVLELASYLDIPTEVRPVSTHELGCADEVLVTNSVMGVLPVQEVAGKLSVDAPGPLARSIRQAYAELLRCETSHPNR